MVQLRAKPRKTVEDYLKLPEGTLAELIEGEILMSPSPKLLHQRIVSNIYAALRLWVKPKGLGLAIVSPLDVHLPSGDVVQPDVIFVSQANSGILKDWVRGAPDLLVEVLSPDRPERDRIIKRALYERNGVQEYWIVDGEARAVEILKLERDRYEPHGYFQEGDTLASEVVPGLSLPVRQIFE